MRCLYLLLPLVACLAAPAAIAMGVLPNCLDELSDRSRVWAECTHKFSRQDDRCSLPTANMHKQMQLCARKGYNRTEIDAAMDRGFRTAGDRGGLLEELPEVEPQPLPKARRGPIPGVQSGD